MGRLVTIVGNSGAGKTTLAQQLGQLPGFALAVEQHAERPFQRLFARDLQRYALPNQADYLLLRAEQEVAIRSGSAIGVQDGGLDLDFYGFTRLFFRRGYLSPAEYELCERLHHTLRRMLPPPDLIIRLFAPLPVLRARHQARRRTLEITRVSDLRDMEDLLEEWLGGILPSPVIRVDAGADRAHFQELARVLAAQIIGLVPLAAPPSSSPLASP